MRTTVKVLHVEKYKNRVEVLIGADEPFDLLEKEAVDLAYNTAKKLGFKELFDPGEAISEGQNELATRLFTFIKR